MLTKSDFQRFLTCKNEFWLDHHFPEEKSEPSLDYQLRREAGYEVEGLATTLAGFKDRNDVAVDFGTEFQTDSLYAKADIVLIDNVTGEIEIYEVNVA